MQVRDNEDHTRENAKKARKPSAPHRRPAVWRPEPTGLTRDEIRRIVLDTLG